MHVFFSLFSGYLLYKEFCESLGKEKEPVPQQLQFLEEVSTTCREISRFCMWIVCRYFANIGTDIDA